MKKEDLEIILSEQLEEIKQIRKTQEYFKKTMESFAENIYNFEDLISDISIEPPAVNLDTIHQIVNQNMNSINHTIRNQPKEVIQEKRILFYPEGDGRNFLKQLVKWLIFASTAVLICYYALQFGFDTLKERIKYKRIYDYIFYEQNDKVKSYLEELKYDFENDSISKIRVKEIKEYKRIE